MCVSDKTTKREHMDWEKKKHLQGRHQTQAIENAEGTHTTGSHENKKNLLKMGKRGTSI